MQDTHAITGGGGGGGGGGGRIFGDRRLRLHNQQNQSLKCPRCDSLNTKFCYYNNYNLSQPRHFCKSCRRYWTKGGVLRNVPVGGGCRKSKRGSSKQKTASGKKVCRKRFVYGAEKQPLHQRGSYYHLLYTTSISKTPSFNADLSYSSSISMNKMIMSEATSETTSTLTQTRTNTGMLNFSNHPHHQKTFPEVGSLMSLMAGGTNTNTPAPPFGLQNGSENNSLVHSLQLQDWPLEKEGVKIQGLGGGILDQTVEQTDLWQSKNMEGGLVGFDWQAAPPGGGHGDAGLFQLPASVDHANWGQSCTEWCGC
ncbi:hypothetical protein Ancab_036074 [Ancistrocladus abbreviatus]